LAYAKHKLGVCRELARDRLRPEKERFLRQVSTILCDPNKWFCIGFTNAQAKTFQQAKTVQMDLSFKMIIGNVKTFTICGWNEQTHSKTPVHTKHMPSIC
jgi:hypothetical protein